MSKRPKRGYFQLHLSTAVVVTIEGGIFLGIGMKGIQESKKNWKEFMQNQTPRNRAKLESEYSPVTNGIEMGLFFLSIVLVTAWFCEFMIRRRESRRP